MRTTAPLDTARLAHGFGVLSDETRLRVVELLADGERCVCELQEALDASQSRLSFHLKKLKEAGVVSDRREGRWVYYSLDTGALDAMVEDLRALRPEEGGVRAPEGCCG